MNETPSTFCLPVDIDRRPEFRNLEDVAGFSGAMVAWVTLFQELAYRGRAGRGLGVWDEGGWKPILRSLGQVEINMANPRETLIDSGLVTVEGDHFRCPLFIACNKQLAASGPSIQQLGAGASLAAKAIKATEKVGAESLLLFLGDIWQGDNGKPLDSAVAREAELLIRTLDRLLGLPDRQPDQFDRGLVRDAAVAVGLGDWRPVVRLLGKHRGNARFTGYSTERVLSEWRELTVALMAIG